MFDINRFCDTARADLDAYAASRKRDVARGAETPELAALLVQKYGYGLAKAVRLAAELADHPLPDLIADVDRAVAEIDQDWRVNQVLRFESRPASISYTKNG
ncbi:hypothetical protein [Janthinobacterium sp. NKUCC06_STL]|uniref:hypothetical protein n=1 Tax=Janthinobacterium sp. NKUCC06_STL TaxID=2842127 RepID=UPI001C5BF921|nr:hypothetical protein [Janthinobacterium sp. NKUCC06_STL]MBW3512046.1 hypothetical protein [Janthinobacterium sp. NKUCC06_STL]